MIDNIDTIKRKSASSVIFLSIRNLGLQAVSVVGFFLLTVLLGTDDVGLFAIVVEAVSIFGYFSDLGFISALIQQKDEPNTRQLRSTFTIQQGIVFLCLIFIALSYPSIASSRHYGSKETWILIALCFSFFTASLKTVPSVLLERKLEFKLLSTIDILENVLFYTLAVIFAYFHFGAYSYAIATFVKSLVGVVVIYFANPWPIGIDFSLPDLRRLFKFGIPYQINSLIAMAKDRFSNLFVAGVIGRDNFAFLTWGQKVPSLSLGFMNAVMKVTFPAFSRLQEDKDLLRRSIEKSLYFIALLVFPLMVFGSFVAKDFIYIFPKYTKWLPGLIPLYVYAFNYSIAAITTPLTNALNAVGKITVTTRLMIMWTVLTWIFFPILSLKFGLNGALLASVIVNLSSFYVWYLAKKIFDVHVFATILHPSVASLVLIPPLFLTNNFINHLGNRILIKILLSLIIYATYNFIFSKKEINWFYHQAKCLLSKKES